MRIAFQCPNCQQLVRAELANSTDQLTCMECHWIRSVPSADIEAQRPSRCLVCGCEDLWRQKDFPQGVGLAIVAVGAILSTIAWSYMWPLTAIGILMAFALADFALYAFMKDVLVCYRCAARYRSTDFDEDHPAFDLEVAERYRQELLRLKEVVPPKT